MAVAGGAQSTTAPEPREAIGGHVSHVNVSVSTIHV
jgi:hypothetical protein